MRSQSRSGSPKSADHGKARRLDFARIKAHLWGVAGGGQQTGLWMIRYSLKCAEGHGFESWFQSGEAFETLAARGMVACPLCGNTKVEKTLMAPAVRPARTAGDAAPVSNVTGGALSAPRSEMETAMAALRQEIEKNSDYVGMNFVNEARRIHAGNAPERAIHGEAKPDEARKLIEDGVPVAPLPFLPSRKVN